MEDEEKNKMIDSIEKIWSDDTFGKLFINSLGKIKPSPRRSIFLLVVFVVIYTTYVTHFIKEINAIDSTLSIINTINSVFIPIFAVIITGFAIFQALTNGRTLLALLRANENEKSKFQEYNYFFFSISILYLFFIILNFTLTVFLNNTSHDWYIVYFSIDVNNKLFSFLVSIYLTCVINSLIEMKSFIYNLYQVFSASATANAIEYFNSDNKLCKKTELNDND